MNKMNCISLACTLALLTVCSLAAAQAMEGYGPIQAAQQPGNLLDLRFSDLTLWMQILVLTVLGVAGLLSHFLKKWYTGEIAGSLVDYLVRDNPRRTVASIMGVAGAIGTAYLAGQFGDAASIVTLKQVILPAWGIGYAGDSLLNKGATPA
jgi:hypothetical protein